MTPPTGTAAANYAGPALALAFILAAAGCTLAGLCYAEFASMIPVSGSAYSYTYATLGEGIAWFIGWNLILEYLFAVSAVSVGWSGYVVSFLQEQLGVGTAGNGLGHHVLCHERGGLLEVRGRGQNLSQLSR